LDDVLLDKVTQGTSVNDFLEGLQQKSFKLNRAKIFEINIQVMCKFEKYFGLYLSTRKCDKKIITKHLLYQSFCSESS
jgi:hypothetical protein